MKPATYLIVEKGDPYQAGVRIELAATEVCLGRSSETAKADISFSNYLVSRRHCSVFFCDGKTMLQDLGSKHGTMLNGKKITPLEPVSLSHGDRIGLAAGMAVLRFVQSAQFEETMDISGTNPVIKCDTKCLELNIDKVECKVDGRIIPLAVKEWLLLRLLYENAGKLVGYPDIKSAVWPERVNGSKDLPDVGLDEINMLVYRLRKKLGQQGGNIKTIRGRGCILE